MKRGSLSFFMTVAIAGGMVLVAKDNLRINITSSMPLGVWMISEATKPLDRGSTVIVCLPTETASAAFQNGYIGWGACADQYEPLLKPIGAVGGDVVTVSSTGLAVNGVAMPNTAAKSVDTLGRVMETVPPGQYTVAPGTVWIIATRDELSFDSRYFGPLDVSAVTGTARPLIVTQ